MSTVTYLNPPTSARHTTSPSLSMFPHVAILWDMVGIELLVPIFGGEGGLWPGYREGANKAKRNLSTEPWAVVELAVMLSWIDGGVTHSFCSC